MNYSEFKSKLDAGFKRLRRRGYFARQSWQCCQTCGNAAVPEGTTKVVFYHQQDAERIPKSNATYLTWTADNPAEIRRVFEDVGLIVDHDGSEEKRIYVRAPDVQPTTNPAGCLT